MDVDELLRAVAHPARREILRLCGPGRQAAGTLADALGLAPASTSEHLKVLRKAGLVELEKQGTFRWYRTNPALLRRLARYLTDFSDIGGISQ
ncbi:metalloregulator ArsR/SmtB family transcription factor [Dactylosporangium salmoneum]|uniref:Metalloregulator ArsR/SmtB family transcription factor n=1 Tax=Dactylosporangium salmoneum TaxID=53361 RepID=A0ABP5UBY0_9ACTN